MFIVFFSFEMPFKKAFFQNMPSKRIGAQFFFCCKKRASVPSPSTILTLVVLSYFPPKDVHSSRVNRTSRRRVNASNFQKYLRLRNQILVNQMMFLILLVSKIAVILHGFATQFCATKTFSLY